MSLSNLPNELLSQIIEDLERPGDFHTLLLTNRRLAIFAIPFLSQSALQAEYSMTALFYAAANRLEPMVRLILEEGEEITVVAGPSRKEAKRVVYQSSESCSDFTVKFVMDQGVNLVLRDSYRKIWTSLHWAAKIVDPPMLQRLLDKGADLKALDYRGRTLLHLGSRFGPDVVRVMLKNGASISARDPTGGTPLHTAASQHSEEVVEILLESGADVNAKDKNGGTPLYNALRHSKKIAELLLRNGADVNAKDKFGRTPLQIAALGLKTMVIPLQESGANDLAMDINGQTP